MNTHLVIPVAGDKVHIARIGGTTLCGKQTIGWHSVTPEMVLNLTRYGTLSECFKCRSIDRSAK